MCNHKLRKGKYTLYLKFKKRDIPNTHISAEIYRIPDLKSPCIPYTQKPWPTLNFVYIPPCMSIRHRVFCYSNSLSCVSFPGNHKSRINWARVIHFEYDNNAVLFKVLQIIRSQQLQVKALNASSQNFGQPAINLANYKKSVLTILYALTLFSFCYLPYIILLGCMFV